MDVTHRIAIGNSRILRMDEDTVTIKVKDHRSGGQWKELTLNGIEFVRRFLMHVPPKSFVRIHHYGILSNQNKRRLIPIYRNLIGCREFLRRFRKDDKAHAISILYKKDVTVCPCCCGSMSYDACTEWPPRGTAHEPQSNRIWDIRFGGKGEVYPKQEKFFRNLIEKYPERPSADRSKGH